MDILNMKNFSKILNDVTFTQYYNDLSLLALCLFDYEDLPNFIKDEWIEKYLFSDGECMFFDNKDLGYMVAKVSKQELNNYDEPVYLKPVATNFHDDKTYINGVNCVLIKNNPLSIPTELKVKLFAHRLAEITRTQDININAQKTPILIHCSDKQKLSLKNIYNQYKGNEPVIYGDKSVDFENIQTIKTDAPIVFDKLELQKHQVMNEFLTFIGINNANMDKKERLVDDEVQANNESVESFFNTMLKSRENACKEINRLFGTNIKVKRRTWQNKEVLNGSKGFEDVSEGSEQSEVV